MAAKRVHSPRKAKQVTHKTSSRDVKSNRGRSPRVSGKHSPKKQKKPIKTRNKSPSPQRATKKNVASKRSGSSGDGRNAQKSEELHRPLARTRSRPEDTERASFMDQMDEADGGELFMHG